MSITAIIPAAGTGTRLRPHTWSRPKALLPVAGRTVLGHIIERLVAAGVDRVVLVVGYLGEQITDWVKSNYPELQVDTVFQAERLGLGHAIFQALEGAQLKGGRGLVILGDTIVKADVAGLLETPGNGMGVCQVDDPTRFGVAVVEGDRIVELEEKPQNPRSNLVLVGLYAFRDLGLLHRALNHVIESDIRTRGEFQLTDALQYMIERGEQLTPFPTDGWFDVGKDDAWLATNRELLTGAGDHGERQGVIIHPPVYIPGSAQVTNSEIGPWVSCGENIKISDSRVENTIIGDRVIISDCRLHDSLVGANSRLAGVRGRVNLGEDSELSGE